MAAPKPPASFGFERRNPLPVGRYWYFATNSRLHPTNVEDFDEWLSMHRASGALRVEASEFDKGGGLLDTDPPTSFTVFRVLQPNIVHWDNPGLPDRAPEHVTSAQDVVSAPTVLEPAERLEEAVKKTKETLLRGNETLTLLLFGAAVLYLLTTNGKRHALYD